MKFLKKNKLIKVSIFETKKGYGEYYFVIETEPDLPFEDALEQLYVNYSSALKPLGLSENTHAVSRFYLSDMENQKHAVLDSKIFDFCKAGTCSLKQQPPLNGSAISLFVYHLKDKDKEIKKEHFQFDSMNFGYGTKLICKNYDLYTTANFAGWGNMNSYIQTNQIFTTYCKFLLENNMTLLNNTLRTWVFVRDIENHYNGMVKARKDIFDALGLNKNTRYIASTGIESRNTTPGALVALDALSMSNLVPGQMTRMEALENLCPTHEYGVTFERGQRVDFGDRSHFYISGTASIDKYGKVLYPGNIEKQTERSLENVQALLEKQNAQLSDLAYLIVYLRNTNYLKFVQKILRAKLESNLPIIHVRGAVCRPAWLIEIEGVAIKSFKSDFPTFM